MGAAMHDRWEGLCGRVGAFRSAHESDVTFEMLSTLYTHPLRAYHNLEHIAQVLGVFDTVRGLAEEPDAAEFALWMHDCVYFAERPDNEERSADAAGLIAGLLGCPAAFTARVRGCIMATRHSSEPGRGDFALVADVDLSILGATTAEYDEYRRLIRREFGFWDGPDFGRGRLAFVRRMLDKKRLYATPYFFGASEKPARANLEREAEELERGIVLS